MFGGSTKTLPQSINTSLCRPLFQYTALMSIIGMSQDKTEALVTEFRTQRDNNIMTQTDLLWQGLEFRSLVGLLPLYNFAFNFRSKCRSR